MTANSVRDDNSRTGMLAAAFDGRLPAWATPRNLFLLLLLVSLCVDLAFGFIYKFRPTPGDLDADELEYFNMATGLMDGTLQLSARRTLAFPLLIAGVRSISSNFLLLQVVAASLFSFSAPLLFLVVRRVTGSVATGAAAGLALALWPPVIYYGVSLYSEAMALPVFLLALLALPPGPCTGRPRGARDWPGLVIAGIVLACATQVRPMYLLMTPFIALIVLIEERDWWPAIRKVAIVAAAYTLTTLPWSAYMTARFDHPILVTSNGGETLAGGLNPVLLEPWAQRRLLTFGRNVWVGPGKWLPPYQTGYLSKAELTLPYDQQDRILKERTTAWAKAHPDDALQLELAKAAYMWGVYPLTKNGIAQLAFGNLPTILLIGFSLFCLVRLRDSRRSLARFWILPLFVTSVALISWGSWRFRQPGDAGLVAFATVCALTMAAGRRPRGTVMPPRAEATAAAR